jgi:hypothetical protein
VPIKLISGSDWSTYAATYNERLEYTPSVITLPTTNQNVQDAVTCGVLFGATMQAKGGGHSYASFSTGGTNGDLMIDMQQFQTVSVDANGIATVGAGLRYVITCVIPSADILGLVTLRPRSTTRPGARCRTEPAPALALAGTPPTAATATRAARGGSRSTRSSRSTSCSPTAR